MNLPQLASTYIAHHLGLSAKHRTDILQLAQRIHRALGLINGTLPSLQQLIAWLQHLLDQGRSPHTVNRMIRILNALFRWGAAAGICQPMKLSKVKAPPPIPEAWTVEEVERLLQAAASLPGQVGRWPARHWWTALLLVLYYTGARIGSVLAAQPNDLDWTSGVLWLHKTKNGRPKPERLPQQVLEAIRKIHDPQADRLFVWPHSMSHFWRTYRRLVQAAGLPWRPYKTGTYRLKRTCLTYCWAVDPAIAQRQADHASAEITRRHYVDPRLVHSQAKQAADVLPTLRIPQVIQRTLF